MTRPGFTCELLLYQTRPGLFATAALWTPAHVKQGPPACPFYYCKGNTLIPF